ncbi:hypothetical protein [Glycomyces arizonensis]|uniref:hypothetical protein n=1 Tax=Glycomyces arizonensis TaxID=256035 RepID=UPI0012EC899F|nr:hypothetical protein [Glycomyces arizonensis]
MTKTATLCKRCGKPVPQVGGRGRPRLYCAEGDCATQAKRQRELRRATPGLEGALARAEELYEQIEQSMTAALAPLAEALRAETDPAEVEARLAEVRGEAAAAVAAARAERDEATGRSESLDEALAGAKAEVERVTGEAREAQARAKEAVEARLAALKAAEEAGAEAASARSAAAAADAERQGALDEAEAARAAAVAARAERDRALDVRAEAEAAAVQARGEAEAVRERSEAAAAEAAAAVRAAEEALRRSDERAQALTEARDAERGRVETLLAELAVARRDAQRSAEDVETARQALAGKSGEVEALASDKRVLAAQLAAAGTERAEALRGLDAWRERALAAEALLERSRDEAV